MATAITELAVGEALVSFLDAKGRPSVTERVFVLPPGSQIGPITPEQRKALIASSLVAGTYEKVVDRESAYEKIKGRAAASPAQAPAGSGGGAAAPAPAQQSPQMPTGITLPGQAPPPQESGGGMMDMVKDMMLGTTGPRGGRKPGLVESAAQSAVKSIGSAVGREIIRGVLGSLLGGGRRR
jgi:DNA helicase HerA-like ATPase